MNRFTKPNWKQIIKNALPLPVITFAIIICIFLYAISNVSQSPVLNEKELLEKAIWRDVAHCYAVEGEYPPSLSYMTEHYGLTYDTNKFLVNYENIGANIMPTVHILER